MGPCISITILDLPKVIFAHAPAGGIVSGLGNFAWTWYHRWSPIHGQQGMSFSTNLDLAVFLTLFKRGGSNPC